MNLAMQPHTKPKVAMKKSGAAFESLSNEKGLVGKLEGLSLNAD